MAEWLRHWTRDPGVSGSISASLVKYKSLGENFESTLPLPTKQHHHSSAVELKIKGSMVRFSQCWLYVESLVQALNPPCIRPPCSDGYLVHDAKVGSTCAGCTFVAALYREWGMKSRLNPCVWVSDCKSLPLLLTISHLLVKLTISSA